MLYNRVLDFVVNSWENLKNDIDNRELLKTVDSACTGNVSRESLHKIFQKKGSVIAWSMTVKRKILDVVSEI